MERVLSVAGGLARSVDWPTSLNFWGPYINDARTDRHKA